MNPSYSQNLTLYVFCTSLHTVIKLYSGVAKPGLIQFYDSHGEVNRTSAFDPAVAEYAGPFHPGGIGLHETGHRGTQLGLNM